MKKWMPMAIVAVLAILLFLVQQFQSKQPEPEKKKPAVTRPATKDPASKKNRNNGFDRNTAYLEYTVHARCRMECRRISSSEVEEMMRNGKINYAKSNAKGKPCPTYAVEGLTKDGQKVRIVYAQCDTKTKVVTVIDLQTNWECSCPGDDEKYKNKR